MARDSNSLVCFHCGLQCGDGRAVSLPTSATAAQPATWGSAGPSQEWAGKPAHALVGDAGSPAGSL